MSLSRVLRTVRETRHLDLEDVATFTHISPGRLHEFESGVREPSFRQIERLAEVYGVASYLLTAGTLPNLPETLPDFRRQVPGPSHLSAKGIRKIWFAEQVAAFTHQLIRPVQFSRPSWSNDLPRETSARGARELRRYFDEWLTKRRGRLGLSGAPEQQFLLAFRLFAEALGVVFNVNTAPPSDFAGFYIKPADGTPLAFINRSIKSRKAQLFTALHEYAHHLSGMVGVSNPYVVRNSIERTCNQFAAEFLAPMSMVEALVRDQSRHARADINALIRVVSDYTLLSRHASAIRLAEAELISQGQLATWVRAHRRAGDDEVDDIADDSTETDEANWAAPHAKRVGELGYLPVYLTALAIDRKIIDTIDVQAGISLSETLQARAFSLASRRMAAALSE